MKPVADLSARPDARTWKIEADGVLDSRLLPAVSFDEQWDAIVVDPALKAELLSQGILNFTLRRNVDRSRVPLHGIILLVGPPGTGKTSLARGLASRIASSVEGLGAFRYIEVEPHGLASSALGRSQKAVTELFTQTIAEHASQPLIVLLDEVETLAADRSKLSLDANPVDVHRATDAVLAQLDNLASNCPNLLVLATSNFPEAIDSALVSRADLVRTVGLPTTEARRMIIVSTLDALAEVYEPIRALTAHRDLETLVQQTEGFDGRQVRKVVVVACAQHPDVALNPEKLAMADLLASVSAAKAEQQLRMEWWRRNVLARHRPDQVPHQ